METIISVDGTQIAFEKTGSGPPLVLIYGNSDVYQVWKENDIQAAFGKYCTVYTVERRGRGRSGDHASYSLNKEAEDIAAVVNSIREPVILLGHSGGAIYSLEAALKTNNLNKLILYEPPLQTGGHRLDVESSLSKMHALLKRGNNDGVLVFFMQNIAGLTPEEIDGLRKAPIWQDMVVAARVLPRELEAISRYRFAAQRFADMDISTLLLTGSKSPPFYQDATQALHNALPNSQMVALEGQQHQAMQTAPSLFIEKVLAFALEVNTN
jgi:pimeloyl-ACP methyl ester carboxylesterase